MGTQEAQLRESAFVFQRGYVESGEPHQRDRHPVPVLPWAGFSAVQPAVERLAEFIPHAVSGAMRAMCAAADGQLYHCECVAAIGGEAETAPAVGGEVCKLAANGCDVSGAEGRR